MNVRPGERLLLTVITDQEEGGTDPSGLWTRCVFELDDHVSSVPILEKMALLDSTEGRGEPETPQRTEALQAIISAYDTYTIQSGKVNSAGLSFISKRMGDSDPEISRAALRWVYSKVFGGGTHRFRHEAVWISKSDEVLKQLRREASDPSTRRQALRLLQFFGCESQSTVCKPR